MSGNTSSLVDQSSASDLIGVGLNLAGLSGATNDKMEANSVAVTATAYTLYSAFKGADPLRPDFYNSHEKWRRLSFTLGYDKEKATDGTDTTNRATLAGAKILLINKRDATRHVNDDKIKTITDFLGKAATDFGRISKDIQHQIFEDASVRQTFSMESDFRTFLETEYKEFIDRRIIGIGKQIQKLEDERAALQGAPQTSETVAKLEETNGQLVVKRRNLDAAKTLKDEIPDLKGKPFNQFFDPEKRKDWTEAEKGYEVHFYNTYLGVTNFPKVLEALGEQKVQAFNRLIEEQIDSFVGLNKASQEAIELIRKAPQFSVSFQSKTRKMGVNEYMGEAIFDYGIMNRLNLTLNGAFEYKDSQIIGGDTRGARVAGQLQFQITPEKALVGRNPILFDVGTEAKWMSGMDATYKAQVKIKIPVMDGIDFPISFTFANKTELINEMDVRGQFGFTFDLARLGKALGFK
ncbi:MAG TPA: hypothetical protein VN937_23805 [Blastocatellia bacterium]|nr:hypothetical protein [Blastocatellia bacterium]